MFKKIMPFLDADDGTTGGGTPEVNTTGGEQLETTATEEGNAKPQANIKVKFNGEEKELTYDEARELAQKGMNYDHVQESWEKSKSVLSKMEVIARRAGFVDENGHGDIEAYREAAENDLNEYEKSKMLQGIELPKEIVDELYESRKEREARKAQEAEQAKVQTEQQQFAELLAFYKEANGKEFDPETDKMPKEVWEATTNGTTPKAAYAEYLAKQLLNEKKIEAANKANAESSAGSVGGGESASADFTLEQIKGMSREEVLKNYSKIAQITKRAFS